MAAYGYSSDDLRQWDATGIDPNPGPHEAAAMPAVELQTLLARRNYGLRHNRDPYWQRLHRAYCRQAIRELRYLTNRPSKAVVPCGYGHTA